MNPLPRKIYNLISPLLDQYRSTYSLVREIHLHSELSRYSARNAFMNTLFFRTFSYTDRSRSTKFGTVMTLPSILLRISLKLMCALIKSIYYEKYGKTMRNAFMNTPVEWQKQTGFDQIQRPSRFITAQHLADIVWIKFWIMQMSSFSHSWSSATFSSFTDWKAHLFAYTRLASSPHTFSIGFKSGLWAGQSIVLMLRNNNQSLVRWAVCIDALSCWNMADSVWFSPSNGTRKLLRVLT